MAFLLQLVRLLPSAARVVVAGGAAYGSVRVGAWEDTSGSKERLENWRHSLRDIREIEYPPAGQERAARLPSLQARVVSWWNSAVQKAFHFTVTPSITSDRLSLRRKS